MQIVTGFSWDEMSAFPGLATPEGADVVGLAKALTGSNDTGKISFGTEAGLFHDTGIPTVGVMGMDPSTSVVNEWGRSHDVKNLFIIDGSLFVTGAAINPTPTIQALALYVAESIKDKLADASLFD